MTGDINSATIGIQDQTGTNAMVIAVNNNLIHNEFSINIEPRPLWLNLNPLSNSINPGNFESLYLEFNSTSLISGTYDYNLEILSNDFHNPSIIIPITLNINDSPCAGQLIGDLNGDGEFNVLDIIIVVNIILYSSTDECELTLSDLNNDYAIDILDIVLLINLILS